MPALRGSSAIARSSCRCTPMLAISCSGLSENAEPRSAAKPPIRTTSSTGIADGQRPVHSAEVVSTAAFWKARRPRRPTPARLSGAVNLRRGGGPRQHNGGRRARGFGCRGSGRGR